uniref:Uncharacterized protein n=1 Tax=Panagrolaimus davidi TaxID=227884 RepID=A0A914Q0F6_9BILA
MSKTVKFVHLVVDEVSGPAAASAEADGAGGDSRNGATTSNEAQSSPDEASTSYTGDKTGDVCPDMISVGLQVKSSKLKYSLADYADAGAAANAKFWREVDSETKASYGVRIPIPRSKRSPAASRSSSKSVTCRTTSAASSSSIFTSPPPKKGRLSIPLVDEYNFQQYRDVDPGNAFPRSIKPLIDLLSKDHDIYIPYGHIARNYEVRMTSFEEYFERVYHDFQCVVPLMMSESESEVDFFNDADFEQIEPVQPDIFKERIPFYVQRLMRTVSTKTGSTKNVSTDADGKPLKEEKTEHQFDYETKKVFKILEFGMVKQSPYELLHNVASRFVKHSDYKKCTHHIYDNALIMGINASRNGFMNHNNTSVISYKQGTKGRVYIYQHVTQFEMHTEFLTKLISERNPDAAADLLMKYFCNLNPAKCHKLVALAFFAFFCEVEFTLEAVAAKCQLISYCLYSIGNSNVPITIPFFQDYIFQRFGSICFEISKKPIGSKKSWDTANRTLYLDGDLELVEEVAFTDYVGNFEAFNILDIQLLKKYYLCSNFDSFEHFIRVLTFMYARNEDLINTLREVLCDEYGLMQKLSTKEKNKKK